MKKLFISFFLMIALAIGAIQFGLNTVIERMVREEVDDYYRGLVQGTIHMLESELGALPADRRALRLKALEASFGWPLAVVVPAGLALSPKESQALMQGEIIVRQDGNLYYHRIGRSDQVLILGPIPPWNLERILNLFALVSVVLIVALCSLVWALTYWRNFQAISQAASAFGQGRLEVRARVSRWSTLHFLAKAFNRMAEHIQALIESHRELTNAVSHELRTPISRIRFALEMTAGATDAAQRERHLAGLQGDVDELDDLVSELLTHARLECMAPQLEWRRHDLRTWLAQVAESARSRAGAKAIEILDAALAVQAEVGFEERYLRRAVLNLLHNAAVHADTRVRVTVERRGDDCLVHVDDDGPGIALADRQRVFAPFVRLDTSRSRSSGGHGLGLAIVKRVAAWHGGTATADASDLGGARLTLRWPGFAAPPAATVR